MNYNTVSQQKIYKINTNNPLLKKLFSPLNKSQIYIDASTDDAV